MRGKNLYAVESVWLDAMATEEFPSYFEIEPPPVKEFFLKPIHEDYDKGSQRFQQKSVEILASMMKNHHKNMLLAGGTFSGDLQAALGEHLIQNHIQTTHNLKEKYDHH